MPRVPTRRPRIQSDRDPVVVSTGNGIPESPGEPIPARPAPLRGGAPEPYQPTEADWADYHAARAMDDLSADYHAARTVRNPVYGYE